MAKYTGRLYGRDGLDWHDLGFIFFITIMIGLILFIVRVVKRTNHSTTTEPNSDVKSLEVLKERYAKRDIHSEV